MTYRAPVPDIVFTMRHVAGLDRAVADGVYGDLSTDLAVTILDEAGRFANDVIAPLNREGDKHGVDDGCEVHQGAHGEDRRTAPLK